MFVLRLALAVIILLAIILCAFESLRVFPSKTVTLFTSYTTAVAAHLIIPDLTVYIFFLTVSLFTYKLDPRI